jgi:hypothetical protein
MEHRPNFKRLRDAFAILDGIPDKVFDLDAWTVRQGDSLSCGAEQDGWLVDPRGNDHECDECGKTYHVPNDVAVEVF